MRAPHPAARCSVVGAQTVACAAPAGPRLALPSSRTPCPPCRPTPSASSTSSPNRPSAAIRCVFEDARGMDEATMQALALQFNLSETTFLLPSTEADAAVRIFTPGAEMRFAGHPTLGTAHVLRPARRRLAALGAQGRHGTGTRPGRSLDPDRAPCRPAAHGAGGAARRGRGVAARLDAADLAGPPLWVDTGADQLLVPLRHAEAVRRACPDSSRLEARPQSSLGRRSISVRLRRTTAGQRAGALLLRPAGWRRGGGPRYRLGLRQPRRLAAGHRPRAAGRLHHRAGRSGRPACRLQLQVGRDGAIQSAGA